MKRLKLLKHLRKNGCVVVREGAKHSVVYNRFLERTSTVPRHTEVHFNLVKKICNDLSIEAPLEK